MVDDYQDLGHMGYGDEPVKDGYDTRMNQLRMVMEGDEQEIENNNLVVAGDVVVEGEEKEEVNPVQEIRRCLSLWLSMNIIDSLCDKPC
ncbi:hypothetical protein C5167_037468 [Papaver somniferum]|uniref:Uncharacterized protein n=1 Tax=Papaver somniferum TaxID=3469 RepID=A0A4Y7I9J2_PAPSO|nr:hypothetical protein C5167_037468 [Papaver somniferum]